ncbi:MAG: peroxiredoxin [Aquabacterium sp.]|uniref:peroxiredoxin n=1 Tax=Aquabacterium sp. TaxID=1872578 RepID=UPI003BBC4333
MKHWMVAALLSSLVAAPAWAALKEGDAAPDFKLQASQDGKAFTYSLKDQLKKGPVVVYFYPSAYTGGCNVQAHTFAVNVDKFAAAGASIVGVSLDSIARLNKFSADPDYCAGKIPVASDPQGAVSKAFDLAVTDRPGRKDTRGDDIDHAFVERTTFVVTPDGKVAATIGGVAPLVNVDQALEAVKDIATKRAIGSGS